MLWMSTIIVTSHLGDSSFGLYKAPESWQFCGFSLERLDYTKKYNFIV